MEVSKEEEVSLQVRSWIVKFASEKESCMETEEAIGSMFKEALQRVRLGPRHRFSKDPRKAAFAAGVLRRVHSRKEKK